MYKKEKIAPMYTADWILTVLFFVVTGLILWGFMVRNDILMGFIVPICLMAAVIYLGIMYVFQQKKMLKEMAEVHNKQ